MLINCPECNSRISDKAVLCPHCGYITENHKNKLAKSVKSNKRQRLPNGFGQITEIKNKNLRKPFRVMITVGKNENGKPICKLLKPDSYFKTYNEAYQALIKYNANPYDIDSLITVKELYVRWSREYFKTLNANSSIRAIESAWKYCSAIYDMKVKDVRIRHIKGCISDAKIVVDSIEKFPSENVKNKIKSIFNLMFDYAIEYELTDRNYSRNFKFTKDDSDLQIDKTIHISYSDEEMDILWNNINEPNVDLMIIQCYSGWRPDELLSIKLDNVNVNDWTFKSGSKTSFGKNRIVPIHSKIQGLILKRYNHSLNINSEYLFNDTSNKTMSYNKYYYIYRKICSKLNINTNHRPHDGRVHFVTNAKKYNLDEYAIKYIVGHRIEDLTERVYTKRNIDWLRSEIEKIKK